MTNKPSIKDLLNNYTDSEIPIIGLAARLLVANGVARPPVVPLLAHQANLTLIWLM